MVEMMLCIEQVIHIIFTTCTETCNVYISIYVYGVFHFILFSFSVCSDPYVKLSLYVADENRELALVQTKTIKKVSWSVCLPARTFGFKLQT